MSRRCPAVAAASSGHATWSVQRARPAAVKTQDATDIRRSASEPKMRSRSGAAAAMNSAPKISPTISGAAPAVNAASGSSSVTARRDWRA
jgi:hypothetical protein